MKTYILFPNNLELKAHFLLSSEDNFLKTSNDISLDELSFIESKDNLFYLISIQNSFLVHKLLTFVSGMCQGFW